MPVYTYQCDSCDVRFDRYQKFSDQHLTWCPECGKKALRKVFTPVGIVFKGSGFYSTDNRSPSGGYNSAKTAEKTSEGDKSTSETKPAAPSSSTTNTTNTTSTPTAAPATTGEPSAKDTK